MPATAHPAKVDRAFIIVTAGLRHNPIAHTTIPRINVFEMRHAPSCGKQLARFAIQLHRARAEALRQGLKQEGR
jgi:hypothetical protein